jgi:hypothetical protein
VLAGDRTEESDADMFGELFARAQADGKLAEHIDVGHLSRLAQMHVSEGVRHWALGSFGDRSFAEVVADDIAALVAGFNAKRK